MQARSLSPAESQVVLSLEAEGRADVSIGEIARRAGVDRGRARKLAHTLVRKGWLQRVGRGRYILNPPSSGPEPIPDMNPYRVGSHLVEPYYFAYGTAANLHGFLTQAPRVYDIATPTAAERSISHPAEYRLVHVAPRKFFGWQETTKYGAAFHVSDPEKTVLDCLDRQDLANDIAGAVQVLHKAKPRLDYGKLEDYVRRMGNKSLAQRLGYLLEHVQPRSAVPEDFLSFLRAFRGRAFVRLASAARHGTKGRYHSDWRVVVNVPESVLMGEVRIR